MGRIMLEKADAYFDDDKFTIALKYYKVLASREKESNEMLSFLFFKIGRCYYEKDLFAEAIDSLSKALVQSKKISSELKIEILRLKSTVHFTIGHYKESLNDILKAKQIFLDEPESLNSLILAKIYDSLANHYSFYHEFEKSIDTRIKAIKLIEGKNKDEYSSLGLFYNNLAVTIDKIVRKSGYSLKNRDYRYCLIYFSKAIYYLKKYPPFAGDIHLANLYSNMSFYYLKVNNRDKELWCLKKSFEKFKNAKGNNDFYLSGLYINLGYYYLRYNKFYLALEYFKKSLRVRISKVGTSSILLMTNYLMMGDCYFLISKLKQSLNCYQKALFVLYQKNKYNHSLDNPPLNHLNYHPDLITLLFGKSRTLNSLFNKSNDVRYLQTSYDCQLKLLKLFNNIRRFLTSEESKSILASKSVSIFEYSILTSLMLSNIKDEKKYLSKAFEFNEKCKSILLLENILDSETKSSGIIPKNILSKENQLKIEISSLEKQIFEEKRKPKKNKNKLSGLEGRLFELKESLNDLMDKIKKNHKEYYDLKYNIETASVNQVQSALNNDALLIEYFIGQEYIFIFTVSKNDFKVKKIKKSKSFEKRIRKYCSVFSNIGANHAKDFKLFANTGHYLYKLLLKDVLSEYNDIKSVVIIPDGSLNFIPFETLLTERHQDKDNFKSLNYLIEKYSISYSYSATLFCRNSRKTIKTNKTNKILSFAPTFSASNPVREDALRSGLESLKWNKKEASLPAKYFDSRSYKGKYATKKNFIENASKYSILHLATHGVVEDSNPMFSKIAFAPNDKSVDEGYLHAYELYNMKLNIKLAILSACETGYGKLVKGEGVMSIARGFLFAGSRSIMMSLWQVSDYATYKIVNYFYKGLSEGLKKDEALRQAKIEYIKSSDKINSNPAYWAPFVLIGDTTPL
jgi:CHAT domain-containing protein